MKYNRREFVQSIAAAGASLAMIRKGHAQEDVTAGHAVDDVNIALIGAGAQGQVLMEAALRIPGVRFKAMCDIWEYHQTKVSRTLKKYGHLVNVYEDYKELLDNEKDLDAAIVATPDWMHAEHANACMEAGLNVYCEKEMSNSLEKARTMVETSRRTGKLLQIGHQRRSNPRYIHAVDTLIHKMDLLGRVTHAYGQWNRSKTEDLTWPEKYTMSEQELEKWGYDSMSQFRNWRWYKKYGGGPIVDLGSHQIDLFAWVYGNNPKSVIGSGGINYYPHHEWYDNVLVIYEYENDSGVSRAFYQTLTTTKHGGFYETFMGENGTIVISEVPDRGNVAEREAHAPSWDPLVKRGMLRNMTAPIKPTETKNVNVDVRVTAEAGKWPLPVELAKPAHQPHLENFFDAIRYGKPLNCPAEIGYETAVAVLACNQAVDTQEKIDFKPSDFHI